MYLLEETQRSVFSLIPVIFLKFFRKIFGLPMNKQYNDNCNKSKNGNDKDDQINSAVLIWQDICHENWCEKDRSK